MLHISVLQVLVVAAALSSHEPHPEPQQQNGYEATYEQLEGLSFIKDRVAYVTGYTIERDVGRLTLHEGDIYLLSPVAGRTVAAVFRGEGTFEFAPPTKIEREQLRRFYDTEALNVPFKDLFLFFTDSTLDELESNLRFEIGVVSRSVRGHLNESLNYLSNDDSKFFHPGMMSELLNTNGRGLFYAHIGDSRGGPYIFELNPYEDEEVRLLRRARSIRSGGGPSIRPSGPADSHAEVICQFDRRRENQSFSRDLIEVNHYNMNLTIESNLDFRAATEITVTSRNAELSWVPFRLFDELDVESVGDEEGTPAQFYRGEGSFPLWIEFSTPLDSGETRTVNVSYGGDLISRLDDWYQVASSTNWYPRYGMERSTFDMTVRSPARLRFVGAGDNVATSTEGDMVVSRWVTPGPFTHSSFNLGEFEDHVIDFPGIPHTTVMMATGAHRALPTRFIPGANMITQVGADVANSLAFFSEAFGEPIVNRFCATEILAYHGQAFPGMVHLSFLTFHDTRVEGADEVFRAHEMAHQWWGLGVGFDTYHDQWLDEGLAEFSGLLYLEKYLGQTNKVLPILAEYRKEIFNRGDEAGPPWLGQRLMTSSTPNDYRTIVYGKGAWIIQMLRHIMSDMNPDGESRFLEMLREYHSTYRGMNATTEDFKEIVEKHIGMQMDWFFDQWVYGNDLPRYELQYISEPIANGRSLTRVRIRQSDVPDTFQMFLPLELHFADGTSFRVQLLANGPMTEATLPPLAAAPERIVLIPAEEVLAEVGTAPWESEAQVYAQYLETLDQKSATAVPEAYRAFERRFGGRSHRAVVDSAVGVFQGFQNSVREWWSAAVEHVEQPRLAQIHSGTVSTDDTLALRLQRVFEDAGIAVDSVDGHYFLADSVGYLNSMFTPHVSKQMAGFLYLRQRDREEGISERWTLNASPTILAERLVAWDSHMADYPENIFLNEATVRRQLYVRALLAGNVFDPDNDWRLREDVNAVYREIIETQPESETLTLLGRYYRVLSDNDFKPTREVRRFLDRNGILWIVEPPEM